MKQLWSVEKLDWQYREITEKKKRKWRIWLFKDQIEDERAEYCIQASKSHYGICKEDFESYQYDRTGSGQLKKYSNKASNEWLLQELQRLFTISLNASACTQIVIYQYHQQLHLLVIIYELTSKIVIDIQCINAHCTWTRYMDKNIVRNRLVINRR